MRRIDSMCWDPLSKIRLEVDVELRLHVTLKVKVIQIYLDRNILRALEMALDILHVLRYFHRQFQDAVTCLSFSQTGIDGFHISCTLTKCYTEA